MGKRICGLLLGLLCSAALTGCGQTEKTAPEITETPRVELVVWGAEEDKELMNLIIRNFETHYQGQADFRISFEAQGKHSARMLCSADWKRGRMYLPLRTTS